MQEPQRSGGQNSGLTSHVRFVTTRNHLDKYDSSPSAASGASVSSDGVLILHRDHSAGSKLSVISRASCLKFPFLFSFEPHDYIIIMEFLF